MLIWIPNERAPGRMGELPPDAEFQVWEGGDAAPGADDVEVVVHPGGEAPQAALVSELPKLRLVQALSAGIDWLLPLVPSGVTLCDARGVHDTATAEWVVTATLAAIREFPGFALSQARGEWDQHRTGELAGATVLIVGYGSIGAAVERRLGGFGVEVLRVARRARGGPEPVHAVAELPELLPRADVVVLLVPLTSETHGLAGAEFLGRMRDGALLVNAARGPVVDTEALLAELTAGRLRAALDVTDPEPLPAGHPLWSAPGALITPHVGGNTTGLPARLWAFVGEQLRRYAAGQPLANVVTGEY